MATATVSASVDADTKRIVAQRLREHGTTPNKVIHDLWEHIAFSGEIPDYASQNQKIDSGADAFNRLMQLRSEVKPTPELIAMDTSALRHELMNRDA